jgi:glycosyltransferase involved in cell wall biosynthesis
MDTTRIPSVNETKRVPGGSMPVDRSCDLSVGLIVPVFNEGESLDYYLSRLYEVTRARCPVVLVDGGSTDSSVSIGQRYFHTESTSRPNRGEQLNRGARCLLTDVVLFLHADTELPRGFAEVLGKLLESKENCASL